jgi:hypothetical protein
MAVRPTRRPGVEDPGRLILQPTRVTLFLLAGIVGVAALTFMMPTAPREPPIHPASAALDGCAERGGAPTSGPFKERYCRVPYADGGRACTDKSQCQGACIVLGGVAKTQPAAARVFGVCETANVQYGCFSLVEHGAAVQTICVD